MKSEWLAPAKINHFIHILGRRCDGYHDIQTIFQFVALADKLELSPRKDGKIIGSYKTPGIKFKDDLVYKSASLLQATSGTNLGVNVVLKKQIPVGGGLGGGSSNAATMLVALNELWKLGYTPKQLMSLGASLGSDVPIFVFGQSAWAEGRGEMLEPIELNEKVILLLFPNVSVSTKSIFSNPLLPRDSSPIEKADWETVKVKNDFLGITTKMYPEVERALFWLSSQTKQVFMSGTGSTLFALFDSDIEAKRVKNMVPHEWNSLITKCLNRSPLFKSLEAYQNITS